MTRYVTLARPPRTVSYDDWYDPSPCTMEVITASDEPIDTGLLAADGTKLYRLNERAPIGFCRKE